MTAKVSPARQAASASPDTGSVSICASQTVVDEAVVGDAEGMKAITLSVEVLLLYRYARVSHQ